MSKFRALLCQEREEVAPVLLGTTIMFIALGAGIVLEENITFFDPSMIKYTVLLSTAVLASIVLLTMIRFSEHRFRTEFRCEPPRTKQEYAKTALSSLVDMRLAWYAAMYDTADHLYTKVRSDRELELHKTTNESNARYEQLNVAEDSLFYDAKRALKQFQRVDALAAAFGFKMPDLTEYRGRLHAKETAEAVLEQGSQSDKRA